MNLKKYLQSTVLLVSSSTSKIKLDETPKGGSFNLILGGTAFT